MMHFVMTIAPALCGVGCLYKAWNSPGRRQWGWVASGWLLWLVSLIGWIQWQGAEFGLVFALSLPPLLVWPLIAARYQRPQRGGQTVQQTTALQRPSLVSTLANIGRFLWLLVGLGMAALLFSLTLVMQLPFAENLNLTLALVVFPLLWALAVCWFLGAEKPWKMSLLSVVIALLSSLWLFAG